MPTRPTIGFTTSVRGSFWIGILHRIAIWRAGGKPVLINAANPVSVDRLDALVVGGGDDISFHLQDGELNPDIRYDAERDKLERGLLECAFSLGLPVLGICRGAQMINLVRGGTIWRDIAEIAAHAPRGRMLLPKRRVSIQPTSRLARILKCNPCRVNALHHQAVDKTGDGLEIVGRDQYNIVQAIEAPKEAFLLGVQWHPEMLPFSSCQQRLFDRLVEAAA